MSQDKVTRENLALQLSEEFGIAYTIAYKKIDLILNLWANSLIASDLNISSLGSFKINKKNSRLGRNPKTKEEHVIKSRKVISFKRSKNLEI
jgi:integration host factor subunit alpha